MGMANTTLGPCSGLGSSRGIEISPESFVFEDRVSCVNQVDGRSTRLSPDNRACSGLVAFAP